MKEYSTALFLVAEGSRVIGTTMLELWKQGGAEPVAALSTIQMAITAVLIIGVTSFITGVLQNVVGKKATLKLASGELLNIHKESKSDYVWKEGEHTAAAIRSERVEVLTEGAAERENTVKAKITSRTYLGSKWQYTVETSGGSLRLESTDAIQGTLPNG